MLSLHYSSAVAVLLLCYICSYDIGPSCRPTIGSSCVIGPSCSVPAAVLDYSYDMCYYNNSYAM